jgi:hypothetical protein
MKTRHFTHAEKQVESAPNEFGYQGDAFDWFGNYCELAEAITNLVTFNLRTTITDAGTLQQETQQKQLNNLIDFFNKQSSDLEKNGYRVKLIEKDITDYYDNNMANDMRPGTNRTEDEEDLKPAAKKVATRTSQRQEEKKNAMVPV